MRKEELKNMKEQVSLNSNPENELIIVDIH